ncbi:hypothetical protein [Mycobacterium sp. M23085]
MPKRLTEVGRAFFADFRDGYGGFLEDDLLDSLAGDMEGGDDDA